MSVEDAKAVAAYVRSVLGDNRQAGQAASRSVRPPPSVLVGDAKHGQAYFKAKCSGCHSASGDLRGIATKYADPKVLQNTWVAGGGRPRRGAASAGGISARRAVTVRSLNRPARTMEGRLRAHRRLPGDAGIADGTLRTFRREGDVPKVEVRDPMKAHRDLLSVYTDTDMHDVTAYLVTLK